MLKSDYWNNRWKNFLNTGIKCVEEDYHYDMHDIMFLSQMITSKVLFLLVGVSGSGKTTASTKIENMFDCIVYEQDVMLVEGYDYYQQTKIYNYMLSQSNMVCVDATNLTKDMRERFIIPAQNKGFLIVAIMCDDVELDVIIQRNHARGNMDIEKIRNDVLRIEVPKMFSETNFTVSCMDFFEIFVPLFLTDGTNNMFDFRKKWIVD